MKYYAIGLKNGMAHGFHINGVGGPTQVVREIMEAGGFFLVKDSGYHTFYPYSEIKYIRFYDSKDRFESDKGAMA